MSSYYKCELFNQKISDYNNFSFIQEEIFLKEYNEKNCTFEKNKILYKCSFEEKDNFNWNMPIGIICIKDNIDLLAYTLNNLKINNVYEYVSFIVVDDRSVQDIKSVCENYPVSYLRVDNEKGFNFSILNNIAAKIALDRGSKDIILWNSDLFVPDDKQIPQLLDLHYKNDSTITGTKLLYPPFAWNGLEEATHNIQSVFPNKQNSYRNTIQFGGGNFAYNTNFKTYFPNHYCRFKEKNYFLSSQDKLDCFITGAFQIINLSWFFEAGGLNCSMSLNFQDVDLCLRATKQDKKIYYFGKDNYLLHDESVSISKSKNSKQFINDHMIYCKIWDEKTFLTSIMKLGD